MIELDTKHSARLADDVVVWLTTVDPSGTPQPTPVWFLWTGSEVLIFSQPNTAKLRNIGANPRVAVNLNSSRHGGDFAVLRGNAVIGPPSEQELASFDEKYASNIKGIGMTPESFHASYSVPLRVTPTKVRSV